MILAGHELVLSTFLSQFHDSSIGSNERFAVEVSRREILCCRIEVDEGISHLNQIDDTLQRIGIEGHSVGCPLGMGQLIEFVDRVGRNEFVCRRTFLTWTGGSSVEKESSKASNECQLSDVRVCNTCATDKIRQRDEQGILLSPA